MKKHLTFIICMLALSLTLFAQPPCGGTQLDIDCNASPGDENPVGVTITFGSNPTRLRIWDFNDDSGFPITIPNQNIPSIPSSFNTADYGIVIPCDGNVFIEVVYNNFECTETFNISELVAAQCIPCSGDCGTTDLVVDCDAMPGQADPVGVTINFGNNPTRFRLWNFNLPDGEELITEIPNGFVTDIPSSFNTADNGITVPCNGNIFIEVVYSNFDCPTETFNISNLIDAECIPCSEVPDPCGGTGVVIDCDAYPGSDNPAGVSVMFGPNPKRVKVWDFENSPGIPIVDIEDPNIPTSFNTADNNIILPSNGNFLLEVNYEGCREEFDISDMLANQCGDPYAKGEEDKGDKRNNTSGNTLYTSQKIAVYPNPTSDRINLTLPLIEGAYQSQIFDLNGKLLSSDVFSSSSTIIDVQDFQNGIYLLKITGGEYNFVEKIQIIR